jgi:predicted metal-dependent phosphoesterase TrpH
MIALTDHNSCRNTPAAVKIGKENGLTVVPGMELCTAEEAHVICLFPTVEAATRFDQYVAARSVKLKNRPEIFGRQLIVDENETIIGEEENLLLNAAAISVNDVQKVAHGFGGAAFLAHVDRNSFSVIASLGTIPPEANFAAAEVSERGDVQKLLQTNTELEGKILLLNSDAHYLEDMMEPKASIQLPEKTPECLIAALCGEFKIKWNRG